jgi:hypothetical protein
MPYKSGVIVWRDLNPVCSSAARMRFAIILLALDLACDPDCCAKRGSLMLQ